MLKRALISLVCVISSPSFAVIVDPSFGQNGIAQFRDKNSGVPGEIHSGKLLASNVASDKQGRILVVGNVDPFFPVPIAIRFDRLGNIDTSFGRNGIFGPNYVIAPSGSVQLGQDSLLGAEFDDANQIALFGVKARYQMDESGALLARNSIYISIDASDVIEMIADGQGNYYVLANDVNNNAPYPGLNARVYKYSLVDGALVLDSNFGGGQVVVNWQSPGFSLATLSSPGSQTPASLTYQTIATVISSSNFLQHVGTSRVTTSVAQHLAVDGAGRVLIAGLTVAEDKGAEMAITRLLPDGQLDPAFGVNGVAVLPDVDKAKLLSMGGMTLPPSNDIARRILITSDNKIVVVGSLLLNTSNFYDVIGVTRLLEDGSVDTSFGTDGWTLISGFLNFYSNIAGSDFIDAKLTETNEVVVMYGYGNNLCDVKQFSVLTAKGKLTNAYGAVNHGGVQTIAWTKPANFATDSMLQCQPLRHFKLEQGKVTFAMGNTMSSADGGYINLYQAQIMGNDATPNAFSFTDVTRVSLNTQIESSSIQVLGTDRPSDISIINGEYSINGRYFTAQPGTVNPTDTVVVRQLSANTYKTKTDTVLTIGGVSDTFSSTTKSKSLWQIILDWLKGKSA